MLSELVRSSMVGIDMLPIQLYIACIVHAQPYKKLQA